MRGVDSGTVVSPSRALVLNRERRPGIFDMEPLFIAYPILVRHIVSIHGQYLPSPINHSSQTRRMKHLCGSIYQPGRMSLR